jgi:hypothetical protein
MRSKYYDKPGIIEDNLLSFNRGGKTSKKLNPILGTINEIDILRNGRKVAFLLESLSILASKWKKT